MENLEAILDDFEHLEEEGRADAQADLMVEEALNLQQADEEALEAVEKVAHVAQSSLRRLQQVVKEKDELISVLQDAVGSSYKKALDQQESDQHDLELLHQLLLAQEDRSIEAITDALQTVIRQQPSSGNSLAVQIARLFDQYLHEISIKHEQETEDLQRSLAMFHNRCQELEDSLDHEKRTTKSYFHAQLDEKTVKYMNTKSQLEKSEELVEDLKRELKAKDEQLRTYENSVRELERLLEEERAREQDLASEHERICTETRRSLGQVSNVGQQLQKLKEETHKYQQQGQQTEFQFRTLQDKVAAQKALIHKLAVQLAALRKKTKVLKPPPAEITTTEGRQETRKQTQILQNCIEKLSAQILELEKELREVKKESDDPAFEITHDITVTDETRILTPLSLAEKSLGLVQRETMNKLQAHEKLTKTIEQLQRRLKAAKLELKKRDNDMSVSGATIEQLRFELRKSKETVEQLQEKKRKKMESGKKKPTDCVRMKGLLENIEMLDMENTLLKHEVMVQKNRRIAKLERDLKRAQGLDLIADGTQLGCSKAMIIADENAWEKAKKDLEDTIVSKDSLILELRFEVDQATWKLGQVEKRFNILFGALDCQKIELNAPVADTLLENIFSSDTGQLSVPALSLLREKVLSQRGFLRSGSRERELEDLVTALMKVVEKLNSENEALKLTCEDTVKQMEKNKKLRKVVNELQSQIGKVGGSSQDVADPEQKRLISGLRAKLQNLTDANAGLIKALRESEDLYSGLKQRVHDQESKARRTESGLPPRPGRRLSFSDEGPNLSDQNKRLKTQADTIERLETQLAVRDEDVAELNRQLEKKDDELDLLHGKLWLQESAEEPTENIYQKKVDMWSAQEARTKFSDVRLCRPEDYIDTEFITENEWESLKEENRRLKVANATEFGPQIFEDVLNLKDQLETATKICERYEELLRIYSRQIGVPFEPLRKNRRF
ncbi:hypothetical protein MPTK1_6g13890 [Marchantia polymorpha subsp. ruderalis]|uniref:Uncharacterized protein n=2 Tax=Marchantia polymorpha TaxID=3197 RepID=A0AAF6BRT5_MARPO|nr:hypothetical protein MARPO_0047s0041 [Marchantia polymorpha]BBN14719.1 hypothetical protein Mp_6g13890 [Marchantia polymorpha subsp. ruderalis]|eukprot:PTQ39058.1 hypothetical protein MARPO_0047s0041 [Marchantia polymorpha]